MRQLLLTILTTLLFADSFGQTHKIIYGVTDTVYYKSRFNNYSEINYGMTMFQLKEPLPDGQWLIYSNKDTTQLIIETNYKDKKKNGWTVHYLYSSPIKGNSCLIGKMEEFYKDNIKIRWVETDRTRMETSC